MSSPREIGHGSIIQRALTSVKNSHGCGLTIARVLVSLTISVPKDEYDMREKQGCIILFCQLSNYFLRRFDFALLWDISIFL